MLTVRATKKLLDRLGPPTLQENEESTTLLGDWYATAWSWRPQVALFVNERTLLPVVMPLAPAATLTARFPRQVAAVLAAHGAAQMIIDAEVAQMRDIHLAKTANRSVVGIMTDYTHLAEVYRDDTPTPDLLSLAIFLARTPCSPCTASTPAPTANSPRCWAPPQPVPT